jgi:hypothetical protein
MIDLLLSATLIAQRVGPGYVGLPQAPFYICLNDPGSFVNLRSSATTNSRSMGRLHQGTPVNILNRLTGPHDGMWWSYVRLPNGGTGYVRDDYVCVR